MTIFKAVTWWIMVCLISFVLGYLTCAIEMDEVVEHTSYDWTLEKAEI